MVRDALRWWLTELRGLIPEPLMRALGGSTAPLFLLLDGHSLDTSTGTKPGRDLHLLGGNEASPVDLVHRAEETRAIILLLPPDLVLQRTVELPLLAERELRAAMSFEVDRQTPFALDQVDHAYRVVERDPVRKRLSVELVVVPKDTLEAARASTLAQGVAATAVRIADDMGIPPVELPLARGRVLEMRGLMSEPWRVIACAALVLLILGLGGLAWYRADEARDLSVQVAERRSIGRRAQALRDEISVAESAARFLPDKRPHPSTIEVLNTLSRTLPDDSWVFGLDITPTEARIEGFAGDVPGVIGLLQNLPIFETPQLRSPVARSQSNSKDRFDLSLTLRPAPR